MNAKDRNEPDGYYAGSRSWAEDRQQELRQSRRIAWIVAGVAGGIALLEAIALIVLTPLKTVVPYTLMVDRTTGYVQAIDPVGQQKVAADAALTESFLVQYVIARESFDIGQVQSNYRKVGLWSSETARTQYTSAMQASNPASPFATYPRSTVVDTQVKSVSPIGPNVALVRFDTVRRDAGGTTGQAQPWAAVVRYRFSGAPMAAADRFTNPLGFQVIRYRRDPEALATVGTGAPVPAAVVSPTPTPGTTPAPAGPTPSSSSASSTPPTMEEVDTSSREPVGRRARQPGASSPVRIVYANEVPFGSPLDPPAMGGPFIPTAEPKDQQ